MPREHDEACLECAAGGMRIDVPSPRLRGEGGVVFQRRGLGEGDSRWSRSRRVPLTRSSPLRNLAALSPQAGRGHSNNGLAAIAAPRDDALDACPCSSWMPTTDPRRPEMKACKSCKNVR